MSTTKFGLFPTPSVDAALGRVQAWRAGTVQLSHRYGGKLQATGGKSVRMHL
jgi:hypothetical protein